MHDDLSDFFARLVDLDAAGQATLLRQIPDEALRRRLQRMLDVDAADDRLDPDEALGVSPLVAPALRQLVVPTSLGPFEVVRELGRGGMGVVYEAREPLPPRVVALKTLLHPTPASVARFEAECVAVAAVEHPAVPAVLQMFRVNGQPVLAMEIVRGSPFLEGVAAMSFDDRIRLLVELAQAVHAIHAVGVVHRDLKPSNLLIGRAGNVRILDFGVASHAGSWVPGAGTVAYMAPQQRAGAAPTPADDVYSLGAIALRVLTGGPDERDHTWMSGLPGGPGPDLPLPPAGAIAPTLPASLSAVIRAALEPDASRRTPSAAAFADALEGWLESELLRMLAATAREGGPAGGGAVRRRAVDSTLAVVRRALATERGAVAPGPPHPAAALRRLSAWLDAGARAVCVYGLRGSRPEAVVRALLAELGPDLSMWMEPDGEDLIAPLAAALGVSNERDAVHAALRAVGAAVIGVSGTSALGEAIGELLPLAPDVRWLLATDRRAPGPARPLQVLGLDEQEAAAWVAARLTAQGDPTERARVEAEVARLDGMPALLEALVARAGHVGLAATPHSSLAALAPELLDDALRRVEALSGAAHEALVTLAQLPRAPEEDDARAVLGPAQGALDGLVDLALVHRHERRLLVPAVVVAAVHQRTTDDERAAARARWLDWLPTLAAEVERSWLALAPGVEERLDEAARHVNAATPHLTPEALHAVAAHLADGLSLVGHREVRTQLDAAVLAATPDPLVSRNAMLAWVHAIMRHHRRGDLQAVPTLRQIRLATADADGNLLSQVAHVEASRYPPGDQEPAVTVMLETWPRLRAAQQEAWGAWMIGAQAPISRGMGLPDDRLLRLAEDAVASIRPEAPELARVFARQALSFAWIDGGREHAGARLGQKVSDGLAARGLHRIAASFSTYIGKAWAQLGELDRAEQALQRAADHGVHLHPPHALQWLALLAIERGDLAHAGAHLDEAERRMPRMEHALLHHHTMCRALLNHALGETVEARQLYRSLCDGSTNLSGRRRGVAFAGLILLTTDQDERAAWTAALIEEAHRDADAWPAAALVLGEDRVPPGHGGVVTPMIRILQRLSPLGVSGAPGAR